MNRVEAGVLLTYIARTDHRTWGEDDAIDLADLLDDIALADATAAARDHLRSDTAWLTPAIIRQRVKALRAERIRRLPLPCPNIIDGIREHDEMRAIVKAIGDGRITTWAECAAYERWGGSLHLAQQTGDFPILEGAEPVNRGAILAGPEHTGSYPTTLGRVMQRMPHGQ